jgi:periplasmic protein TonB
VLYFNTSLPRFFAASLALHLFLLSLFWRTSSVTARRPQPIAVSLLPPAPLPTPPLEKIKPRVVAPKAPTRPVKAPSIVAKKNSPVLQDKSNSNPPPENVARKEPAREEAAPRKPVPKNNEIAERPLPTLKELLPPVTYSPSDSTHDSSNAAVSLNTNDPIYVTYVTKIRQSIESEWQYPAMALKYGLQGKATLEFVILENGQLEGLSLIRSSGSALLDDEALRAIRAAAPFPPIPPWIKPNPLTISATMEYRDNRLNYRFAR